MESAQESPSEFVPLTEESRELYESFWTQIGRATTTAPPMDFLSMKEGALRWSEELALPAGLLEKFRQWIAAAQCDRHVLDLMEQFSRFSNARVARPSIPAPPTPPPAAPSPAQPRKNRYIPEEKLLADLKRVAQALRKKTVTAAEYRLKGQYNVRTLTARFEGWNNALLAAGLESGRLPVIPVKDLFENLARLRQKLGRLPKLANIVKPRSKFSPQPYLSRFGSWTRTLKAFDAWVTYGTLPPERPPAPPKKTGQPSARQMYLALKRDNYKCTDCGKSPATHPGTFLEVDHKTPRVRFGPNTLENLRTLCRDCNRGKSDS